MDRRPAPGRRRRRSPLISATRDHGTPVATIDTVDEVCVRARWPGAPLATARPGVVAHPMRTAPKCLGGREVVDRQRLDPVLPRELYQDRRWSSPQIAAHLDSTVKSNGAADPARPWHPGPPRRTAAPPDTRRWPAVDRPVQRPGDHCAAAPPPDPAAAPTRRHHRPLPHPGPHHRGSCAPRTWTSGWPRCTSSNSPDTPPNRSWTYCTSTASTASRSSAPAATPPGCRRHHHHLR